MFFQNYQVYVEWPIETIEYLGGHAGFFFKIFYYFFSYRPWIKEAFKPMLKSIFSANLLPMCSVLSAC